MFLLDMQTCMCDMTLVMSQLRACNPEVAKTTEIVVFPRRGARSGGFIMLKPQEENQPRDPPRTFWGHLGDAVGRPWGRSGSTFGSTAWLFAAVFDQIRSFSANFCYFVRRAIVLGATFTYFPAILANIRLKSGDFADRVAGKTENH